MTDATETPAKPVPTAPRRVLLLNDDHDLARLLSSYLEDEGCTVFHAEDGLKALDMLAEVDPHLIVSDVHMPRLDGFQFCRVLRSPSHRSWNKVPVLLVSSTLREHSTLEIGRFVGANDFLALPCGREDFVLHARRFLGRLAKGSSWTPPAGGRGGTILVVDDDEDLAAEVAAVLRHTGYEVALAHSAAEARTIAEALEPFFVLTDYQMPGETGMDLLDWFRQRYPETIVTLLTGAGSEELGLAAIRGGASDYLEKPVNLKTLPGTVEQIIRKSDFQRVAERFHRQILLLRAKNKELEEAHRLKNRFLSMASHDLINPLNVIKNWAETILDEAGQGTMDLAHQKGLQVITRQSDAMLRLIRDVLDLTRLEDGREKLALKALTLEDLLYQQVEAFKILARRKGIELTLEVPEPLPKVMADAHRISEVFNNLLGNAVKFCRDGDRIMVSAWSREDRVEVDVADTGPGLAPEDSLKIFEVFQTGSARPTGGEGGSGLGLAIVKGLVDLHGGCVEARARPGGGSLFTVSLPLGDKPLAPRAAAGPRTAAAEELAALFLEGADERLGRLRAAVEGLSVDELFRQGHSLAGAADSYGLPDLGEAGRRLELLMGRIRSERLRPDPVLARILEDYAAELALAFQGLRQGIPVNLRSVLDRMDRWSPEP